jgi:Ner family transcriptional regulator
MDDVNSSRQITKGCSDWHPADVSAALKKRGISLSGLSVANGYHSTAAGKALKQSWPALEAVIATALGIPAEKIWPSRYLQNETNSITQQRAIKKK